MSADADKALEIDASLGTEIELPADSAVITAPPAASVEAVAVEPVAEVDEPEAPAPENKSAPKFDEEALSNAIKERANAIAERDAARKAAEDERKARAELEGELRKTGDQATRAYWEKLNADRDLIANSHAFMLGEMGRLKQELKTAYEFADHDKAVSIQEEMALHAAKLRDLERGKESAEEHIETAKRDIQRHLAMRAEAEEAAKKAPKPEPEAPKQPTVDEWISRIPGEKTQAWLKSHSDFVTDPAKNQQFIAFANYYAAKNGGKLDHAGFAEALNREFDPQDIEEDDDVAEEAPKPEPKAAAPRKAATAAPVSRPANVFSSRNLNGSKIKLPPHVADFVKSSGLDPVKYAEGLVADIKAGKLPKNYLDNDYPHEAV